VFRALGLSGRIGEHIYQKFKGIPWENTTSIGDVFRQGNK